MHRLRGYPKDQWGSDFPTDYFHPSVTAGKLSFHLSYCPEFYAECARLIKARTKLWVLIETNGYGLTLENFDRLQESGGDAFWLDIKAFNSEIYQ
jgi:hypothetical protein